MVPSFHGWDSPERHRQALWFSSATNQGDYFVFADSVLNQLRSIGTPVSHGPRCSTRVVLIVRFDNPIQKDRFRRLMAICLFGKFTSPGTSFLSRFPFSFTLLFL
jgi:hypothetical protein